MSMLLALALALLGACSDEPEGEARLIEIEASFVVNPQAPSDPLAVNGKEVWREPDGTTRTALYPRFEPRVVDAAGQEWATEPLTWDGEIYAWAPVTPWEPGEYSVTAIAETENAVDLPFTIGEYGVAQDFDPTVLAGRTWRVGAEVLDTTGLDSLLLGLGEFYLLVGEADEEAASFRLVSDTSGGPCLLYQGEATVDARGLLSWSADRIEADTEPGPTVLSDLALTVLASEDGAALRGGYGQWTLDGRAIGEMSVDTGVTPEQAFCDLARSVGAECQPCLDGVEVCVSSRFHMAALDESDATFDEELPTCVAEIPEWGLPDCSCATVGGAVTVAGLWLAVAGVLRRRRRETLGT